MDIDVFKELVSYFKNDTYDMHLFGQGDASIFPFEDILLNYKGMIVNLTPPYFYRLSSLKKLGFKVFLRYDSRNDLNIDIGGNPDGTFMVVGQKERKDYIYVAETLLERGYPFMARSMCNKQEVDPPIPLEESLLELHEAGIYPDRIISGKHPMPNCNVGTIRQEDNRLLFKLCINHDADYEVSNLNDIVKALESWDCVAEPKDWCSVCALNKENYRIYCEPK